MLTHYYWGWLLGVLRLYYRLSDYSSQTFRSRVLDTKGTILAAVDLGSNSFHLGIASWENNKLEMKTRLREKIQLAAGLDHSKQLNQATQERALACLAKFGEYTRKLPENQVKIVGTNTFRVASHVEHFLGKAHQLLGHPIHIISGQEEARLIYLGVTKSRGIPSERLLVIDIGGGSTEMIIGERGHPEWLKSIPIGCVSFTQQFFSSGQNSPNAFLAAVNAAKEAIEPVKHEIPIKRWQIVWGTSGTIDAVDSVIKANGWGNEIGEITPEALHVLERALLCFPVSSTIDLPGLRLDRATIFPAGVAILTAVFESLNISQMHFVGAALREGLLYELIDQL